MPDAGNEVVKVGGPCRQVVIMEHGNAPEGPC